MLKILLVSATKAEIEPTLNYLKQALKKQGINPGKQQPVISTCITGVGMVNTAFELGKRSKEKYDFVIQAGIAGSFGKQKIGSLVNVTSDCFSELGAEDGKSFLTIEELGLGTSSLRLKKTIRDKVIATIPEVSGITVNTVHGNNPTIKTIKKRLNPDVESMEGAAFIHAANQFKWQALQLRAISNKVEKRNKKNWNIPLAIKNLNTKLIQLIQSLDEK